MKTKNIFILLMGCALAVTVIFGILEMRAATFWANATFWSLTAVRFTILRKPEEVTNWFGRFMIFMIITAGGTIIFHLFAPDIFGWK